MTEVNDNRSTTQPRLKFTSPPLNKAAREQLSPQSNHFLLASSLTMQEQPAKPEGAAIWGKANAKQQQQQQQTHTQKERRKKKRIATKIFFCSALNVSKKYIYKHHQTYVISMETKYWQTYSITSNNPIAFSSFFFGGGWGGVVQIEMWKYLRWIYAVTMELAYFSQCRNSIIIRHNIIRFQGIGMPYHNI